MKQTGVSLADRPRKDYGYSNARVRGMRSHLLDRAYLESLASSKDVGAIVRTLADTEYGPDLEESLIKGANAASVDEALRHNMVRTYRKVVSFTNREATDLISVMLGRWDLFNIKTIIRGKHHRLGTEEIRDSLVAAGQLTELELDVLASQTDVRAVTDLLVTWNLPYAQPLKEQIVEYMRSEDLSLLELALDRYYSEWAARRLKGRGKNRDLTRQVLGIQMDATNLVTVFRLISADLPKEDTERFYLPGGRVITRERFIELAGLSDIDEVLDHLRGTPYHGMLENQLVNYLEANSVAVLERALEDFVMRRALLSWRGDPLGFGIIISYLWAKQNEVTNLRIIVKGISVGMPEERVWRELILV